MDVQWYTKALQATYWADELKCPVLIIHSKQDWRVSHAQAEKMVQCLEDAGMDYKFISREGDAHGLQGVDDILAIMDWFELINRENQGT